jgi:hypothetical protein
MERIPLRIERIPLRMERIPLRMETWRPVCSGRLVGRFPHGISLPLDGLHAAYSILYSSDFQLFGYTMANGDIGG